MYTRFAGVKNQALASELLNLNTHVEPLMHARNSISNKSLPRDSFLAAEIGGALSSRLRDTAQDQSSAANDIRILL